MRTRLVLQTIAILSQLLAGSGIARAQQRVAKSEASESESEARHHFQDGTKAFNLGEFDRAVKEYRAAYNSKSDPVFLYNIAQAYRLGGDLRNALFFYRSFLNNMPAAPNRIEVERRIHDAEQQLAKQHAVTMAPPNTVESPDGMPPVKAAPPPAKAAPPPEQVDLTPPPPAPSPPALATTDVAPTPHNDRAATPLYKKWWLWTIVGVAAAGVAVGVGVGVAEASHAPASALGAAQVF